MKQLKLAGIGLLVALAVLAVGYLWGARGRWAAEERLGAMERQWRLADARREALAGSVEIYKLNFGAAAGHFEAARATADVAATPALQPHIWMRHARSRRSSIRPPARRPPRRWESWTRRRRRRSESRDEGRRTKDECFPASRSCNGCASVRTIRRARAS
jgi:hypothetical protein